MQHLEVSGAVVLYIGSTVSKEVNPLTWSVLGCWCNLPWIFNCPLFLVSIKQEKRCKRNGAFFQYVMKN
jgi:hypothetical protein